MQRQQGFGVIGIVALVAVLGVGVLVGYKTWQTYYATDTPTNITESVGTSTNIEAVSAEIDDIVVDLGALDELDAELVY